VHGEEKIDPTAFSVLTQREREVLQLLAEGKTTKQIALRLHISPKTVEAHRLRVMNKLDIDNVAQLTKYAIQEGLTSAEP
jgi:DNA-binding NarL/FixJ family response regulator